MLGTFDPPSCRDAELGDQLDGCAVRYIAAPQSLTQLRRLMEMAHERGMIVLPRGGGSKIGWLELPPVIDMLLDLSAFTTLRYDPESVSVTAGAAASLASVQDDLARAGRRLGIDAPSLRATLGGIAVTGETGPLSHRFGPPSGQICDATVILPDGTVTGLADRATLLGAGVFDLSWAYPGWPSPASVIAELNLHTHPQPETQRWLTMPISQPVMISDVRDVILADPIAPTAVELDLPGMLKGAVPPGQRFATGTLSVLLEGERASVLERAALLSRGLGPLDVRQSEEPPVWWGRYPFRSGDVAIRLQTQDSGLHLLAYVFADAAGTPIPVRGSVGIGQGWASLPGHLPEPLMISVLEAVREVLLARGGTAVVQSAPPHLRDALGPYRRP